MRPTKLVAVTSVALIGSCCTRLPLEVESIDTSVVDFACPLCEDPNDNFDPDFMIEDRFQLQQSCLDAQVQYGDLTGFDCTALQMTFGSYCGCTNPVADAAAFCRFCGDGEYLKDPSRYNFAAGTTCTTLEFEAHLQPSEDCSIPQSLWSDQCCRTRAPTPSPTVAPVACSICGAADGDPGVPFPDRLIGSATCSEWQETYKNEQDDGICQSIQATYGYYCGCPTEDLPAETSVCRLCGDSLLPTPGREAGTIAATTCIEYEKLGNENANAACTDLTAAFAPDCCLPEPSSTPSETPTMAPVVPTPNPTVPPPTFSSTLGPGLINGDQTLPPVLSFPPISAPPFFTPAPSRAASISTTTVFGLIFSAGLLFWGML